MIRFVLENRKNLFCAIGVFVSCFMAMSQKTIGHAILKCSYSYTYLKDTVNKIKEDDLLILLIGIENSKCYSYYSFQCDSLNSTPDGNKVWNELFRKAIEKDGANATDFPHKRMRTYVYKNYPTTGRMTITDGISLQDYIYEDTLNTQSWQLTSDTKELLGYMCQKAECDFRGRHWTAWFSPDIPINDGPWKLGGLPGLILEAYDRGMQQHFLTIGLQKVVDVPIILSPPSIGKFEKTNRLDFLRTEKRYLINMGGYIQMETGINLIDNQPVKVLQYDLIERDY